jgi:dolichol-phosphate mannosyltransferase
MSVSHIELSVIIPCFHEAECLPEFYDRISAACHDCVGSAYELVFVDDRSEDATWQTLTAVAGCDPHVTAVRLARNRGQQIALTAGLELSKGDRVFMLDADLQHPPELLPQMMEVMDRGADVVHGIGSQRSRETVFKRLSASAFYGLFNLISNVQIPNHATEFRLISRRVADAINAMPEAHRFLRAQVVDVGFEQASVSYERQPRSAGRSKYTLSRMVNLSIDAITSTSIRPLRLASLFGVLFGVLSLICLAYTISSWLLGNTVEGWTSLMAVVLLIGSAQLFVLGIIGEYLGRVFIESKRRPAYIVDQIVRHEAGQLTEFQRPLVALDVARAKASN